MSKKKIKHISELSEDSRVEAGTEIEFDDDRIPIGSTIEFDVTKPKKNTSYKNLKKKLIIGGIALSSLIGAYFLTKPKTSEPLIRTEFSVDIPETYVSGAIHGKDTFFFGARDPVFRDLTGRQKYVNFDDLSVDKNVLHKSLNVFNQMSLDQIMKSGNLNDVYVDYTRRNNGDIDFKFALSELWNRKNRRPNVDGRFSSEAERMINSYDAKSSNKTDFTTYKANVREELESILGDLNSNGFFKKHFDEEKNAGHPERQRFLENYMSNINEKTVMSYYLTELFPDANPALNAVFFNKLLKEAGEDFINKIPALADDLLSFGPAQLTSHVINPRGAPSLNAYLSEFNRIPASMSDYATTSDHVKGSVLTMLYNAEILMNTLFNNNQLTNFNNEFEKLDSDKQKLLVTGHAVSAHHATGIAAGAYTRHTRRITESGEGFDNIHNDINLGRLQSYHNQSLRNYLMLKEMKKQDYSLK